MFDIKLFKYDEVNHLGYYKNKPIPSVTQLVDLAFPYSDDIPEERLKKAAEKGTKIHKEIEYVNAYFDNYLGFRTNLDECISDLPCYSKEIGDYIALLSAYQLRPFDYEETIFLLDENGDVICYGHYDATLQAMKDIDFGEKRLFKENELYLVDYKTTSLFDKKKVGLQLSIYASAYEQCSKNYVANIFGIWLKEGIKLIPLERKDNTFVINLCKTLKEIWLNDRK